MAMSRHTELLIIGAGPFGLAMAAYASHHHTVHMQNAGPQMDMAEDTIVQSAAMMATPGWPRCRHRHARARCPLDHPSGLFSDRSPQTPHPPQQADGRHCRVSCGPPESRADAAWP